MKKGNRCPKCPECPECPECPKCPECPECPERPESATLLVTKVWQSTGNKTEAELNAMITFNPALGRYTGLAVGTEISDIHETVNTPVWLSADGKTRYTIQEGSIIVKGVVGDSLTIEEAGLYTVVFTNRVTTEDTSASVEVTKHWVGDTDGLDLDALTGQIDFHPDLGLHAVAPGTVIDNIHETFPSNPWTWLSADGKTRYSVAQVSVLVDDVAGDSLTVADYGNHTIAFTNRITAQDISVAINVHKHWFGAIGGLDLQMLTDMIAFYPELGLHTVAPGTVIANIHETFPSSPWTWLSADGNIRYTVTQHSVTVNGVETNSMTAVEGSSYVIEFYNYVTSQSTMGTVTVSKRWMGDIAGLDLDALTNQVTFNPPLGASTVPAGTVITFYEGFPIYPDPWTWLSPDGGTRYTVVRYSTEADGVPARSLTVAEGGNHTIVFNNLVLTSSTAASLEVSKSWVGDIYGLDLNMLTQQIYFNPPLGSSAPAPGTIIADIYERFPDEPWTWLSPDGATRYTVIHEAIIVGGGFGPMLTIQEGQHHFIEYVNRVIATDVRARLEVTKQWVGDIGELNLAELNGQIVFYPGLGTYILFPGTVINNIDEVFPSVPWEFMSADGMYRYTVMPVIAPIVDGAVGPTSLTVVEGGHHTIQFINRVIREGMGGLTVEKVWLGCYEGELPPELYSLLTFSPSPGIYVLPGGSTIHDISESVIDPKHLDINGRRYTITQSRVLVDGIWDAKTLTIVEGGEHTIYYINTVCEGPIPG